MAPHDPRRNFLIRMAGLGVALPFMPSPQDKAMPPVHKNAVNVREHGVAGNGRNFDTKPIQAAIDRCAEGGGGTLYFPAGEYLCGTVRLRSRICLYLDAGARLVGSSNLQDYPELVPGVRSYADNYTDKSLLYGERIEDVSILGPGTIDGQGASFKGSYKLRPYLIRFIECRNIRVEGITLQNSPMWVQHYLACEDVLISGIRVRSRVNENNDGIDIDCCEGVQIANCDISTGDDGIVLKSSSPLVTRNVAISNCIVSSECNAFKLGTESNGGFRNVVISNCSIHNTRLAGLALEIVDGGILDGVAISGIVMDQVGAPVFIRLGDRGRAHESTGGRPGIGRVRNISINQLIVNGASDIGCAIAGLPDHHIENVSLENLRLFFKGGGLMEDARRQMPELPDDYPEFDMFDRLPAYALFGRHVQNLRLSNITVGFDRSESRPGLSFEDVEGLDVDGLRIAGPDGDQPVLKLHQVRDCLVRGSRISGRASAFLQVSGERSAGITLIGNDLSRAQKAVEIVPNVPKDCVFQSSNR